MLKLYYTCPELETQKAGLPSMYICVRLLLMAVLGKCLHFWLLHCWYCNS